MELERLFLFSFFESTKRDILQLPLPIGNTYNLTPQERKALVSLNNNNLFIIREADKEANRQLNISNFYVKLPSDPTEVFSQRLHKLINQAATMGTISSNEKKFISLKFEELALMSGPQGGETSSSTAVVEDDWRKPCYSYLLPKVHKNTCKPPGRPIVSSIGSVCEWVCTYIDFFIQPITSSLPSFIKDTSDFIRICRDITLAGQELLITCDVESLYSNISHSHGIKALSFFLDRLSGTNRLHDSFILDLLNFVLHHNYFLFDRTFYKQISCVAMGACCAPAYANIFLGWDFVTIIWDGTEAACLQFLKELNDNSLNIFLTYSCSPDSAVFLDLRILTEGNRLVTDLFCKPTATNSLLQYQSFHPQHTRMGIPTGQFLRVRRNCTTDECFRQQSSDLTVRFQQRGYPRRVISKAFQRAQTLNQASLLTPCPRPQDSTVRFITEYSTNRNQVRHILIKNWDILTTDSQTSTFVSSRPLMTAKRAPNLRDILTRSHFT
ncbi:unnamed protein product [Ranitomeya imitator]|uniref:Helix-turn-helix domain-containing protein n=1 Tax=Ranitomeya imitator TaxID=111125 RepID=A0ABN9LIV7_9NEOB|nr:unnamed protein product [Ranitomeya imitator]